MFEKKNHYMHPEKKRIKNSTIETPLWLSKQIYDIIKSSKIKFNYVIDVGCNKGNLSFYFKDEYECFGIDNKNFNYHSQFYNEDFLKFSEMKLQFQETSLIITNPPFNDEKRKYGRKLLPELFLNKIFKQWGYNSKIVMISPMGLRLNQRIKSERWQWINKSGAEITSIISLPIDTFKNVLFHSEVLFFNIPNIKSHYWINYE